jgi:hypothetical protein
MQLTFDAPPKETQVAAELSNTLSMVSPIAWIVFIALANFYAHAAGTQESVAEASQSAVQQPWMNPSLDPDTRTDHSALFRVGSRRD